MAIVVPSAFRIAHCKGRKRAIEIPREHAMWNIRFGKIHELVVSAMPDDAPKKPASIALSITSVTSSSHSGKSCSNISMEHCAEKSLMRLTAISTAALLPMGVPAPDVRTAITQSLLRSHASVVACVQVVTPNERCSLLNTFHVFAGDPIDFSDHEKLLFVSQYLKKPPISLRRL